MADDTTAGPTTAATPGAPARIDLDVVRGLIGAARTRLRMQGALEGAVTSSIVASASALGAVFLVRKELISPQLGIGLLIGSAGLIGVGAIVGALGRLDDEQVARKIDRASGLADRLSSAVAFERALATAAPDDADTADLMRAAMRDAAAAAPRANVKAATPLRQPTDTRPALAFLVVAALAASLGIKMPPTEPELLRAAPEAGRRGSEVAIIGERLCGPRKDPAVACALDGALVYVGDEAAAIAAPIVAWTGGTITITVPSSAKLGATQLVAWARGKRLGSVPFEVIADDDPRNFKSNTVALDPDDEAYMRDLVADLRATAEKDDVQALRDYAAKIEQLLDQADKGELTKEQLLQAMAEAQAELEQLAEDKPEQITKDLAETGNELAKNDQTKELGEALKQGDLAKAKEELEKLADKMDQGELSQQQTEQLAKTLEKAAQQYQQKQDQQQAKQDQTEQKQQQQAEEEIRKLEKQRDQAKTDEQREDAERKLEKKKDELRKLEKQQKDDQQKEQSAQREALKRLHKDMEKTAQDLQKKKDPQDQKDQDQQNKDNQKQASRSLRDVADETGKVDQDQRKQAAQKKVASQMDDLREAMRRAKQRGKGQGGQSPFGKNNQGKNQDFAKRAGGGKGQKGAWKPGQGQGQGQGEKGQGKGQGQGENGGDGNQPPDGPSNTYGDGHDDNLVGDSTPTSGNTKDESVSGAQGRKGPSRRETILSAAQKGYASTQYREVYADYKKIVEDVMRSEKVPASYKYYVKKYFTKIKPHAMN
jgi:hypothetical protein